MRHFQPFTTLSDCRSKSFALGRPSPSDQLQNGSITRSKIGGLPALLLLKAAPSCPCSKQDALLCLSCSHAIDDAECSIKGHMKQCPSDNVQLLQGPMVRLDDHHVRLPFYSNQVSIASSRSGNTIMVKLGNGLVVRWNGVKSVEIIAPDALEGQLCGICGSNGGGSDRVLGPRSLAHQCPALTTDDANDDQDFANSWLEGLDAGDPDCANDCTYGIHMDESKH
ncbi:hypothetical protein CAPTEDRAFT_199083 [Capitella teleta]|uniref:VWFD domain-containing protein n=1 Tax=Capitella teleta TaxID=283909 RepID=R7UMF0_CAPTE|nr:hypothetical protein CAPTEDRAFT_199083 [Capitella teleta]|eukprot:ELU07410.1 hypothetical protein CAPTEDRAFT_199083 [Capitella teleta]